MLVTEAGWRGPWAPGQGLSVVRSAGGAEAVGIYGTIVTAAILAALKRQLSVLDLVISVVVTLSVYWVAEGTPRYSASSLPTTPADMALRPRGAGGYLADGRRYFVPVLFLVAAWLLGLGGNAANSRLIAALLELVI